MLHNIHNWFILKLIGKKTVIVNAEIDGCITLKYNKSGGLIVNNIIRGNDNE